MYLIFKENVSKPISTVLLTVTSVMNPPVADVIKATFLTVQVVNVSSKQSADQTVSIQMVNATVMMVLCWFVKILHVRHVQQMKYIMDGHVCVILGTPEIVMDSVLKRVLPVVELINNMIISIKYVNVNLDVAG